MHPENRESVQFQIQNAVPADAEQIQRVRKETWLATYVNAEKGITAEDISARNFGAHIDSIAERIESDPQWNTLVVKEGDRVIAFCEALKKEKSELNALYVLPNFQGRGLGRKLMDCALEWLGSDKDIYLDVVEYNTKAIEFYKKLGFESTGQEKQAKLGKGKTMRVLIMVKHPQAAAVSRDESATL